VSRRGRRRDLPSLLASWRAILAVAWRASPTGALATVFGWLVVTLVAGPLLAIALERVVRDRAMGDPLWIVVLMIGITTPEMLLSVTDHLRELVQRKGEQRISMEIIRAALRPNGIEHLENPKFADRVSFLRAEANQIAAVFGTVAGQAGLALGFLVSLVVLASVSWWLLLPVLAATVLGSAQVRVARWAITVYEGTLSEQRLADRLVQLSASASAAADIRMLGLGDWLLRRFDRTTETVGRKLLRSERRNVLVAGAAGATQALILVVGLIMLLWLAGRNQVRPGAVVLGVALLQTVLESARGLATNGSTVLRVSFAARRFLWLLRYTDGVPGAERPVPLPARLREGVRLDGVSFRYPFTARDVLHDLAFTIPAGTTVALVGENGAGKSTLIKLFCRYYDPTAGRITVDGVDLREVDVEIWRSKITAGFQSFVRFEFPAVESIGASRLDAIEDGQGPRPGRDVVIAQAARAGGAATFLERFPDGYATQLGRQFGGEQLSEGQWQRVAMSRTFLRSEPMLMLLDEPTAALDPWAEHALFNQFVERTREARARGAVAVLVSHRFSTVAMADRIIVLEGGRVREVGDHDALIAADGLYRRSFEAQARRYRDGQPAAQPGKGS
jgi:ATP-binding cassette subfamily B protein